MYSFEVYQIINLLGFILGGVFGAIAQKKQFCFSGSIKDYILTKSTMRASSVVMAMLIAIISTTLLSNIFDIDLTQTAYHKQNINYFAIIFGAALFGVGMMLSDGCSNRHLIKFAQGDKNSLISIVFIAIFAFATTKGLLSGFLNPFVNNEFLIGLSSKLENFTMNIYFISVILILILYFLVKRAGRIFSLWDGVLIGLLVAAAWAITSILGAESFERVINPSGITFVYPTAKSLELFMLYQVNELTFSISLVFGIVFGAFVMSKFNKKYSFGCTAAKGENRVRNNMIGGALMGTGGILSIGCTVGQGLTGLSTLAFASLLAIVTIFISGYITALYLNKKDQLPMCFIFEWKDNRIDYNI